MVGGGGGGGARGEVCFPICTQDTNTDRGTGLNGVGEGARGEICFRICKNVDEDSDSNYECS